MVMRIQPATEYNERNQRQMLTDLDQRLEDLERACNAGNYIIENLGDTRVRTLDVNTASLDDVRKFVATLVMDLKTVGRLK